MLYVKCYKWLLSQRQRVRNDFFGYRRYKAQPSVPGLISSFFKQGKKTKHWYKRFLSFLINFIVLNIKNCISKLSIKMLIKNPEQEWPMLNECFVVVRRR